MLSLFPQILFLAPAGTTLLRIAAAICFAYMAWYYLRERNNLAGLNVPIVGHFRPWMVTVGGVLIALISILLFVGVWTQAVAIVAAVGALKHIVFYRGYHAVFPFSLSTFWLLLCIALMLVVTGAGAFAFDLPL
jgi:hypothetical protein